MWQRITSKELRHVAEIMGVLVLLICFGVRAASQRAGAPQESSTEMQRIFSEDQADRQINMAAMTPEQRLEWVNKIGPRDARRRKQVMDLVSSGALRTGQDFDEAAFIFQHGDRPDDYLLAHTLATVAIAKGSAKSRWIAAATLDRYLQKIQQPQIYGTQYFVGPNQGDKFTQEPYNRQLVPDSLRLDMCVRDQASQEQVLDLMKQGKEPPHHVPAIRFRNRHKLQAAPVKVNSHPTLLIPLNFTFLSIPTIFIHPNDCSTRFRFR